MEFTTEELQTFHRAVKNIPIKKYTQSEFISTIDSLYNAIFTKDISPQTYVNEEHGVISDS